MGTKAGQTKQSKKPQNMTRLSTQSVNKSATTNLKGLAVGIYGDMFLKKVVKQPILGYENSHFVGFAQPPPQREEVSAIWPFPCLKIGVGFLQIRQIPHRLSR